MEKTQEISIQKNGKKSIIQDIEEIKNVTKALLETKHYQKIGGEGVFAIVQKAKSLNIDPIGALNGDLYFVQGKVEMSSQMMLSLIRQAGHSVTMDQKSSDTYVILHGKRKDNQDTWSVSFSIEDAKKQGIYRGNWEKMPKTMCTWRCISMLGRFLFPDVIKGCYVEGEIQEIIDTPIEEVKEETISKEQVKELEDLMKDDEEKAKNILDVLENGYGITELKDIPVSIYERIINILLKK